MANDPRTATEEEVLRSFDSYRAAEHLLNTLRARGVPALKIRIVARDLGFVERVGRSRTVDRLVVDGAWSGAVVGGVIGFFFGMFGWFAPLQPIFFLAFWGVILGGVLGALVAAVASGRGADRQDSTRVGSLEAGCYDVVVDRDVAAEARRLFFTAPS